MAMRGFLWFACALLLLVLVCGADGRRRRRSEVSHDFPKVRLQFDQSETLSVVVLASTTAKKCMDWEPVQIHKSVFIYIAGSELLPRIGAPLGHGNTGVVFKFTDDTVLKIGYTAAYPPEVDTIDEEFFEPGRMSGRSHLWAEELKFENVRETFDALQLWAAQQPNEDFKRVAASLVLNVPECVTDMVIVAPQHKETAHQLFIARAKQMLETPYSTLEKVDKKELEKKLEAYMMEWGGTYVANGVMIKKYVEGTPYSKIKPTDVKAVADVKIFFQLWRAFSSSENPRYQLADLQRDNLWWNEKTQSVVLLDLMSTLGKVDPAVEWSKEILGWEQAYGPLDS